MLNYSLYEIAPKISELIGQNTDPETGEIDESAVEQIVSLEMHAEQKIHNCGQVLRSYDATISSIKNEIDKLRKDLNSLKTRRENLENYVISCCDALSIDSVFVDGRSTEIKLSRERVEITNLEILDECFVAVTEIRKPDKRAIHASWKENGIVPDGSKIIRSKVVKV